MHAQILTFLASSIVAAQAAPGDLPSWITNGPVSDTSFHYVVCSHDGIDPEEARQIAESKCLASAAKLGGVNVKITQKTVQSLTGSDSSEVAEILPLQANIKCEWTERFLEKVKDGFRVWLRCRTSKNSPLKVFPSEAQIEVAPSVSRHSLATLILTTVPQADRVVIVGTGGERVIEPASNVLTFTISNLDQRIEVGKTGYKKSVVELPNSLHGSKIYRQVILERE